MKNDSGNYHCKFLKWINFFVDDMLTYLENGEDLEMLLEHENILEDLSMQRIFKEILKSVGRNDIIAKLKIYLAIG